ncbi:hypothetical protein NX794_03685 [Streptomyces sp. LP11]|uniref:Secreted protein n=1 Tax=Streptomyces pyxinicus TaxID=2970331 RepID=A0ABT2AVY7_9ACTN|nr:hypothetical protein [Streptomyces sp. LP11]MCS0600335.1 hypothetical protein [Streptomyces sp. LP11]
MLTQTRTRRALRFTAVLTLLVLALTGFSRGRHGGHHSGGGGGCGSSHQDHDTSSSSSSGSGGSYGGGTYRQPTHRATATPSSGGHGRTLRDGTARLLSCATPKRPYATVEITNPNSRTAEFRADVTFYDDQGALLLDSHSTVRVSAKGKATTRVEAGARPRLKVDHCRAAPGAAATP